MAEWISADSVKPTHIYSVLGWVIDSPIHFGEDYPDVVIYNVEKDRWQANNGDDDIVVEVSHWMQIDPPKEAE